MVGPQITKYIGLSVKRDAPWLDVMNLLGREVIRMPCGLIVDIRSIPLAGLTTTPCPCGNSSHTLIEVLP